MAFDGNFGQWIEQHGVKLDDPVEVDGEFKGFKAVVDLNQLSVAFIEYGIAEADKATKQLENNLLFDLDEIENKPWRVFRQLAVIMPDYAETYQRYERFYSHGGGNEVMKLIEEFERKLEEEENQTNVAP